MGPLQGLRVIELASIGPVPMCGMLMADLGADVVRIDRLEASGLGVPLAPRHDFHARSKRSLGLDLRRPAGAGAALRLLERADVLIEGMRPGVAERLGIGPEVCLQRNPALVYGRMTGYGQQGPLAQAAGHDLNFIALAGVLHAIGPPGGKPVPPLNLAADYGGGALYLALGVLAALHERQRSGQGQVVDAAMVDGAASLAGLFYGLHGAGAWSGPRGANLLDGGAPFYDSYETADGRYVAIGPLEPKFFAELLDVLGLDATWARRQYDRAAWPGLRAAIADAVRGRTRDEWERRAEGRDACLAPVLSFDEAPAHGHARARDAFVDVDGVVQPAPAPRFGRTQPAVPRRAPEVGEHTEELLAEAGFDAAAIAVLRRERALRPLPLAAEGGGDVAGAPPPSHPPSPASG